MTLSTALVSGQRAPLRALPCWPGLTSKHAPVCKGREKWGPWEGARPFERSQKYNVTWKSPFYLFCKSMKIRFSPLDQNEKQKYKKQRFMEQLSVAPSSRRSPCQSLDWALYYLILFIWLQMQINSIISIKPRRFRRVGWLAQPVRLERGSWTRELLITTLFCCHCKHEGLLHGLSEPAPRSRHRLCFGNGRAV